MFFNFISKKILSLKKNKYNIICIGHSHLLSVKYSINRHEEFIKKNNIKFTSIWLGDKKYSNYQKRNNKKENNKFNFNENIASYFSNNKISNDDIVITFFGGNAHNIFGLVQHPMKFDFEFDNMPMLEECDVTIIPTNLIELALKSQGGFPETEWALTAIRKLYKGRIIQCESPPPIYCNKFLAENAKAFDESFKKYGITSPLVRLKLWRMHSKLVEEICLKNNIEFMKAPKTFVDMYGYLSETGLSNDTTHANQEYGSAVIMQIFNKFLSNIN
jgi:hypothetical protein